MGIEREGADRGFGGFTFVNNGPDKGGDEGAVTPSTKATDKSHRTPNTKGTGNLIPKTEKGNATFDDGLGGKVRTEVLFWVRSKDAAGKKEDWYCYLLKVTKAAGGIELTTTAASDSLTTATCKVKIQVAKDGGYADDKNATVKAEGKKKPVF